MGLPQNLGRLSAGLTADASLNIGVGVTPSGTYKFEVNGALGGTSANFSSRVNVNGATDNSSYVIQGKGNVSSIDANNQNTVFLSASPTANYLATSWIGGGSAVPLYIQNNGINAITISTTGAATFSSTIAATNSLTINSTTTPIVFLNSTGTNQANGTVLQESGTNKWAIGSNLGSADGTFNIYNYGASARYLTIASTGAATFSSSLALNSASGTSPGFLLYNYSTVNAGSRSWKVSNDQVEWGDYVIQQSTTQTGSTYATKFLIDAAGNVGIGSTSPTNLITLQKLGSVSTTPGIDFRGTLSLGGAYNNLDYNSGRIYGVFDADSYASARVTIAYPTGAGTFADGLSVKNGNVVIGGTSFSGVSSGSTGLEVKGINAQLLINNQNYNWLTVYSATDSNIYNIFGTSGNYLIGTGNRDTSSFSEKMRITSGGYAKFTNNGSYQYLANSFFEVNQSAADWTQVNVNKLTSGTPLGIFIGYSSLTPNNTSSLFLACADSTNDKFIVYSTGSVVNRTGSYGTISDIKYKENIIDATPKLADIMQLKVRNFNLIGDETKQIGFIAQEFEEVFPSMIDTSIDKKTENEYKSIKTSVLIPVLVKAIQEQMEIINELKEKIITLESK